MEANTTEVDEGQTHRGHHEGLRIAFIIADTYLPIFLFFFGVLGNIISIIVFRGKAYKSTTTGFYMLALAIFDLNFTANILVQRWLVSNYGDTFGTDQFCKVHQFFLFSGIGWSHWALVAMSVDRCIAIRFPIKAKVWCTIPRAQKCLAVIILAFIARSLPFLWYGAISEISLTDIKSEVCILDMNPYEGNIYYLFGTVVNIFVPFFVLITSNSIIIHVMKRRFEALEGLMTDRDVKQEKSLTVMLLSSSIIFLCLLLPYATDNIYWMIAASEHDHNDISWMTSSIKTDDELTLRDIRWISKQFVVILLFVNPVCNFYVYSVTSSKFRREALSLFRKSCPCSWAANLSRTQSETPLADSPNSEKELSTDGQQRW